MQMTNLNKERRKNRCFPSCSARPSAKFIHVKVGFVSIRMKLIFIIKTLHEASLS